MIWYLLLGIFGLSLIYFSDYIQNDYQKSHTMFKILSALGTLIGIFVIMFAIIHLLPKVFGG